MAFKYVLLSFCALLGAARAGNLLAPVSAGYAAVPAVAVAKLAQPHYDAVGTTQQNVVRSFGGTVSTYSKNVVTPYSSVSKVDSRITNNVYTPTYSAPLVTKSIYAAAAPVAYAKTYAAPAPVVAKTVYSAPQPVYTKSYAAPAVYAAPAPVLAKTYAAPVVTKTYAAPAVYAAPAPVIAKTYAAPAVYAAPAPVVTKTYAAPAVYAAPAPVLAKPVAYAAAPAAYVKYSPAATVAHVSFEGLGAQWAY